MATQWGSIGFKFLFVLQCIFCLHLYLNQISLMERINSMDALEPVLYRNTRDLHGYSEEFEDQSEENSLPEKNVTTDPPFVNHRKQYKKTQRPPVERYTVSTESTTTAPFIVRVSRTKATGWRDKKNHRTRAEHRVAQTEVESVKPLRTISGEVREFNQVTVTTVPVPSPFVPAVIHFGGDIANITKIRHPHYDGNGRIKISEIYTHWKPAHWTNILSASQHFSMSNGKLSILKGGLYLLYAQIHYSNVQEVNCFRALHNGETVAQCCSTTAHPDRHEIKANTCSLFTTVYLVPGDRVWLADVHERYVILTEEKSFFGLVQLLPSSK